MIYRRHEDCLVDQDRPLAKIEDPKGRDGLTHEDCWKLGDLLWGVFRQRGWSLVVTSGDPGPETGRLLIRNVEIPHDTPDVEQLVPVIEGIVLDAFGQL